MEAWRSLRKRGKKNPFLTMWFAIILVFFVGIVLAMADYSSAEDIDFIALDGASIVLLVFFVFTAKSLANSTRRVVRHQPLVFYMSQPYSHGEFLLGFLCGEIFFNLGLLALVAGVAYTEIFVMGFSFQANPLHFAQMIIGIITASIIGFSFAIFNSLGVLRQRIPLLFLISIPVSIVYIIMDTMPLEPSSILFLAVPLSLAIVSLLPAFHVFPDAWNRATAAAPGTRKSIYDRITGRFAPWVMRWIGWHSSLFLEKELVERYRSKEVFGSVIAVGAVAFATLYSIGRLPDMELLPPFVKQILPPLVVGMGLFMAAILEPGLGALGAFGRDGSAFWVVKSSPVSAREIVKAKALASLYTVPLISIVVGGVPAVLLGYGPVGILFSMIMAVSISIFAVGVGIWLGARAPNFDTTVKGYPDIITIYIFAMISLGVSFFSVAPAFFLALQNPFIGLMASIFVADMSILFLYMAIDMSAGELEKLEVQ